MKITVKMWGQLTAYVKEEITPEEFKEFIARHCSEDLKGIVKLAHLYKEIHRNYLIDDFTRFNHWPQYTDEVAIIWTTEDSKKTVTKLATKKDTILTPLNGSQLQFSRFNIPIYNYENKPIGVKNRCKVVHFGGSAGGGKSALATMYNLKYLPIENWNSMTIRAQARDLKGIFAEGQKFTRKLEQAKRAQQPQNNIKYHRHNERDRVWSNMQYGHATEANVITNHQGQQYGTVVFEELTQIDFDAYTYLASRNRHGEEDLENVTDEFDMQQLCSLVGTLNPKHDHWLKEFLISGGYLRDDIEQKIIPEMSGKIRFYVKLNDTNFDWADTYEELRERYPDVDDEGDYVFEPQSYTFVLGKLTENKYLGREYKAGMVASLSDQDKVALVDGSWRAMKSDKALWDIECINENRIRLDDYNPMNIREVVVSIDPAFATDSSRKADSVGLCAVARSHGTKATTKGYLLEDLTTRASGKKPVQWLKMACELAVKWGATKIVYESNQGSTIFQDVFDMLDDGYWKYRLEMQPIHSSKSKEMRARPISILYAQNKVCHVGTHPKCEDEMISWNPNKTKGQESPGHIDAVCQGIQYLFEDLLEGTPDFQGFVASNYEINEDEGNLNPSQVENDGDLDLSGFLPNFDDYDDFEFGGASSIFAQNNEHDELTPLRIRMGMTPH